MAGAYAGQKRLRGRCPYCGRMVYVKYQNGIGGAVAIGRHKVVNRGTLGASKHCPGEDENPKLEK